MSWDIVLFNSKQKIKSVAELDESQLKPSSQLHEALNQAVLHEQKQGQGQRQGPDKRGPFERMTLEIIDRHNGWDGQQIQEVNPNRKAHQIRDENNPAKVTGLICAGFPLQDGPKHKGREQRAQGIDLALDR